ncbi:MAG: hypothetical protein AABW89_03760 [Nanoarchaeota archaeon]
MEPIIEFPVNHASRAYSRDNFCGAFCSAVDRYFGKKYLELTCQYLNLMVVQSLE